MLSDVEKVKSLKNECHHNRQRDGKNWIVSRSVESLAREVSQKKFQPQHNYITECFLEDSGSQEIHKYCLMKILAEGSPEVGIVLKQWFWSKKKLKTPFSSIKFNFQQIFFWTQIWFQNRFMLWHCNNLYYIIYTYIYKNIIIIIIIKWDSKDKNCSFYS